MNLKQTRKYLDSKGYTGLEVSKAEGVYYLIGCEEQFDGQVGRCLDAVRLDQVTPDVLDWKLRELERSRREED